MRQKTPEQIEFDRWLAKYVPVEQAIIKERARRMEAAEKRRYKRFREYGAWLEETEGLAKVLRRNARKVQSKKREVIPDGVPLARIGNTKFHVTDGGIISVLLWAIGIQCTLDIDAMRHRMKRPIYYKRENARRRALADERRKVNKRTTENACPTREEILDAWVRVKSSREAMLHFGSLIEDLECYVDNSLRFTEGRKVIGRAPGIKGWIQLNIPALYSKYKTIMRYKAAAKKLRQIVELNEPTPISAILCLQNEKTKKINEGDSENEILLRTKSYVEDLSGEGSGNSMGEKGNDEVAREDDGVGGKDKSGVLEKNGDGMGEKGGVRAKDGDGEGEKEENSGGIGKKDIRVDVLRARAVYLEAMEGVADNATRTIERLNELLDPERIEDATMLKAWKEKYQNEITVRTKSRWWEKLFSRIVV